ncbi:MAG: COQ9 family protein [Rhodospirillales bacterium]|nr:COQ9 family protein [Alphaproteobacteria bacterium]MCB9986230.1 COQ9 family protein [Rhodospirillales bacterium]USO07215.1 MAG: COQ9 family protein [Rhodospirillales bacterium]
MTQNAAALKDRVVLRALSDAPEKGWTRAALESAAHACGARPGVFSGPDAALAYASDLFDRQMTAQLAVVDPTHLRVRERVARAVMTRLDLMAPYRAGLRVALPRRALPLRALRGAAPLWRSADKIWNWAGDTATDYNRYTKRALLSGVMASTVLFWLSDDSPGMAATHGFLERRIANVLCIGQTIGKFKRAA